MRALIINSVCAAALLTGCTSRSSLSLVVVSVDADAPLADVATLHARVTVGDTTREFDVHPTGGAALTIPPAQSFGIDIPRSMTGPLAVHVEARDSNGDVTASGDGSGTISVGARADVTIHLSVAAVGADMATPPGADMATPPGTDMATPPGDMVVIPPAMLTIDKTTQSFGDITVGKTSTTASFLVINAGGMASSVATLTTGGANVGEFTIDTDCGPALVPGARCHVTASITPTTAGAKNATFTLIAAQGGSVGGTLTANALTPGAVKILQSSGDCGSSIIGTQSTTSATFTVQNSGASPTSALSVGMSDAQFQATGCSGMTLAAGAMCTVTVKFTPSASGTQNASLTVAATTGGTDTASVVGVGLKPASLSVTPSSYTFTSVARGATGGTATFTVSNDGDVPSATMGTATVSGTNPSSFVITQDNCKGTAVGPAPATCTIAVQFKPQVSGSNSATLNVSAGSTSVGTPSLSGVGLNPASLTLTPSTFTFAKGQTTTFTVSNGGEVAAGALSAAAIGGANPSSFTIVSDGCKGKMIGPSASCTIDVKFAPTSTGTQGGTLSLSATPGGSLSSTLGGPGLNPAALVMSPAMPMFTKGQTITFTVTNSGEVASGALGMATLGGANAASFSVAADHCKTTTVGPSPASCTIDVKFAPTSTGTQNATLSITGTPGGTASSSLTGPGLNPASLRLSPDHYTFATTPRASMGETTTFTVFNNGEVAAAPLAAAQLTGDTTSFKITDGCVNVALGPSPASCTISVQFTPAKSGSNSAVLAVSTATTTVGTATLAGTATPIWVQEATNLQLSGIGVNAVWAPDASHVWAVGDNGLIAFRDGTGNWSSVELSYGLISVWGSGPTNIYVSGPYRLENSKGDGAWADLGTDHVGRVWGFSSADVWTATGATVWHLTPATGWTSEAVSGSSGLWGTSGNDLFAFGSVRICNDPPFCVTDAVIWHRTASGWTKQSTLTGAGMTGMWGFGSPASNIYATQYGAAPLHSSGDGAWDLMPSPAPTNCLAVWGFDASHLWFGCNGVYTFDGTNWNGPDLAGDDIRAIWGTAVDNVYAVGNEAIYHYY